MIALNCIIIDDSPSCINLLSDYIAESSAKIRLTKAYTDPANALAEMANGNPIDIMFMDILMPHINGIELSKLLKDKIRYLVITTGDPSYSITAYDVNACAYLMKPIPQKNFNDTIEKIFDLETKRIFSIKDLNYIFIKTNVGELRKVYIKDILAVEGASNYVKIHTNLQTHITYGKMRDYEKNLSTSGNFIRVNKSFIISIPATQLIKAKKIILINGLQIPVGDTYKKAIQHFVNLSIPKI